MQMPNTVEFFVTAIAISLSGVMAPGPISAATLASGTRHRHAGALVALGHALVEIPVIALVAVGVAGFLESSSVRAGIGMAGGAALLLMGLLLLLSLRKPASNSMVAGRRHPLMIGIVLTAANPYFLLWWATVGLALVTQALALGTVVLVLFVVAHWLCDLGWLEVLSVAGYRGAERLGYRAQRAITAVCGGVLVGFGVKLLYDVGFGTI